MCGVTFAGEPDGSRKKGFSKNALSRGSGAASGRLERELAQCLMSTNT